ncbi:MAG: iron-containing redox enzyme family protein [Actinomycetota bacterium]
MDKYEVGVETKVAREHSGAPSLPAERGELSAAVMAFLRGCGKSLPSLLAISGDPLEDEDLQLALYLSYELHYRGFEGVDDRLEWDTRSIGFRKAAEQQFEDAIRASVDRASVAPESVPEVLRSLVSGSPSALARFLARDASIEQFREFVVHRSAYHLKEADPHTWVVPRLGGRAKAALVEIQADEYGGGDEHRMHSSLFAGTMRALALDPTYGRYLDVIPGSTLATVNLMSLFGLNRRLRGAAVGHLAAFELGSSIPNRAYGRGLRRLGYEGSALVFYDEHVEADSVHDMIATYDLAGVLAREEPALAHDIMFGARALDLVESRFAGHLLTSWEAEMTSLRPNAQVLAST